MTNMKNLKMNPANLIEELFIKLTRPIEPLIVKESVRQLQVLFLQVRALLETIHINKLLKNLFLAAGQE